MQRRQSWLREFLIEEGHEALPFVSSTAVSDPPTLVAERMRDRLGLQADWAGSVPSWTDALSALRDKMEAAGILVVTNGIVGNDTHRPLDPKEFRGFVLVDEYAPLVFVNGVDSKGAQMFTLAHELAHVFLGSSAAFDLREMQPAEDQTEIACDRVAAEFLVPETRMRDLWNSVRNDPHRFDVLARRFKVSSLVCARRALDLKLISRDEFRDFYGGREHLAARASEGGSFYSNQNVRVGKRFATAVIHAVMEEKILYTEAYRLTGLHGKSFSEYASILGLPLGRR